MIELHWPQLTKQEFNDHLRDYNPVIFTSAINTAMELRQ